MTIDDFHDPAIAVIYGLDTCEDTTRARQRFEAAGQTFRYVRLDVDTAVRDRLHAAGYRSTPVIVLPDGTLAMEPDDATLAELIAKAGSSRRS
jgi:mycoredoxin